MDMWFVTMNGVRLPTPYISRDAAWAEMRRLEKQDVFSIYNIECVRC